MRLAMRFRNDRVTKTQRVNAKKNSKRIAANHAVIKALAAKESK